MRGAGRCCILKAKSGVTRYTRTTVDINFPDEQVCCDLCPLMETYARKQCRRTGEYLLNTRDCVGLYCPLKVMEEDSNGEFADL